MIKFFLGIAIGILVPVLFVLGFVKLGFMPVATKGSPLPLEHWIVKTALRAAIAPDLARVAPFELKDSERVAHASKIYVNHCGGCHGIENKENLMAQSMFPPAPQFFTPGKEVTDDPVGKIYWKVKHGIRLTGMPAYESILKEDEIWEVSLFLKNGLKVVLPLQ